ncbi:MAG: hypothetical protein WAQ98_20670 [Blastocatellia bacterium]
MALGTNPKKITKFETRKPPQLEAPKSQARFDSYDQALVAFNNKKLGTLPRPKLPVNGPNSNSTDVGNIDSEVNDEDPNNEQDNSDEDDQGGEGLIVDNEIVESGEQETVQDPQDTKEVVEISEAIESTESTESTSQTKSISGISGSGKPRRRNS